MVDRSWIIGSLPDCDLRVDSPTVSGKHCRLTQREDSYLLEDMSSSNGTYVSGERITTPRIVRRNDVVTLGRTVPMPWPDSALSISIGRLVDNDVVVPFDSVSGHHARIERDGSLITLIDLGSTNGTAINDPLNKISRATISSGDFVFLGTHRIPAADLIARLPSLIVRPATVIEQVRPQALMEEQEPVESSEPESAAGEVSPGMLEEWTNPRSWGWGIALSIACLIVFVGSNNVSILFSPSPSPSPSVQDAAIVSSATPAQPQEDVPSQNDQNLGEAKLDENSIRRAEQAVVLLGIRIGDKAVLSDAIGWAIRPDTIVCPTATLNELESIRSQDTNQDEQIVACTSAKIISILRHESLHGFSIAKLEVPLNVVCATAETGSSPPSVDQSLAALTVFAENHERQKMRHEIVRLIVDHIQRADDQAPVIFHCKAIEPAKGLVGSPVFDSSSKVIGTIQAVIKQDVQVVPVKLLPIQVNPSK